MGPLYHLIEEADRKLALKETADRLRVGGVLVSSLLSRLGIIGDLIKRTPHWIDDQAHVHPSWRAANAPTILPEAAFADTSPACEVAPLHEAL